jgi:hypothetical protein
MRLNGPNKPNDYIDITYPSFGPIELIEYLEKLEKDFYENISYDYIITDHI